MVGPTKLPNLVVRDEVDKIEFYDGAVAILFDPMDEENLEAIASIGIDLQGRFEFWKPLLNRRVIGLDRNFSNFSPLFWKLIRSLELLKIFSPTESELFNGRLQPKANLE